MQRLVGHLTSVDPEASESLRIVSYFDVLISRGVGLDGLLRGAAVLSGAIAGAELRGRISRRDPEGRTPAEGTDAAGRPVSRSGPGWSVWIERDGEASPSDEMIVERLALGVELLEARRHPEGGLEPVIDPARTLAERATALARLRIDPATTVRVVATPADAPAPTVPSAIVPTRFGLLRAALEVLDPSREHSRGIADPGRESLTGRVPAVRTGLGTPVRADRAPESWDAAIVAFRLSDDADPTVDAADLGAMLLLAQAFDPQHPHPDVEALAHLGPRSAAILRVLVETESIRSAASVLGMHHSTVQARHEALTRALGYDPRSALGRIRYVAAALLLRLAG